jgi:hypothetical protein
MWFRFVAALSVIAMAGFVWMLLFGKGPSQQNDAPFQPASMQPK